MIRHGKSSADGLPRLSIDHHNAPGQESIEYRLGTYRTLLQRLLAKLLTLPGEARRLSRAHPETPQEDDFAVALLKAWAVLGDVLCFYQERIANEGYLRTARERLSIKELTRQIGYELSPGLAAQTHIAFTVHHVDDSLTIPVGTALQNVPAPGEVPLTFETVEPIEARVEWSDVPAYAPAVRRHFSPRPGAREILLAGIRTGVKPGEPLMFLAGQNQPPWVRRALAVTPWSKLGVTHVQLDQPLPADFDSSEVAVFRFARHAGLFGRQALAWSAVPDAVKAGCATPRGGVFTTENRGDTWKPLASELPAADVRALAMDDAGNLFAGTAQGVFRLRPGGASWETGSTPPGLRDVHSLIATPGGVLWAGASNGNVFRSSDAGQSWELPRPAPSSWWRRLLPFRSSTGKLPPGLVRFLAASSPTTLLAGTDQGIFRGSVTDARWNPWNRGLPGFDSKTGLATAAVQAIAVDEKRNVFTGTKAGLFRRRWWLWWSNCTPLRPSFWQRLWNWLVRFFRSLFRQKSPEPAAAESSVTALAHLPAADRRPALLFVAAGQRIFRSENRGRHWQEIVVPAEVHQSAIHALAAAGNPSDESFRLYVGTDSGVWILSTDLGEGGQTGPALSSPPVQTLIADGADRAWAGTLFDGFVEDEKNEWPNFALARDAVDLDRVYPAVVPEGWVALVSDTSELCGAYPVQRVTTVLRENFKLSSPVTRLVVAPNDELPRYNLRTTTAYFQNTKVDLFETEEPAAFPFQGDSLALKGIVSGLHSQHLLSVSGQRMSARLVAPLGGVQRFGGVGDALLGLAGHAVVALAVAPAGSVIHAATAAGVWIFQQNSWTQMNGAPAQVAALLFDAGGVLCAATPQGVFRFENGMWSCMGLVFRSILALALDGARRLCAGTSDGAFRWSGAAWEAIGLEGEKVMALVADAAGKLWAGTSRGVRQKSDRGWTVAGLPEEDTLCLCFDHSGQLHAGTDRGVWRLKDNRWQRTLLDGRITVLAAGPEGRLYAGGPGLGLWVCEGDAWNAMDLGASNDVAALAIARDGSILAGLRNGMVLTGLDHLGHETVQPAVLHSFPASLQQELALGLLTPDLQKALLNAGFAIAPEARLISTPGGKAWILAEPAQARVFIAQDDVVLFYADEPLIVMAPVTPNPGSSSKMERWTVRSGADFVGTVDSLPGQLVFFAGCGEDVSEVARIESVLAAPDRTHTTVVLAQPLVSVYAPASVSTCANVAAATHGETVRYELLGSGDAHVANQRFVLRKSPLTYLQSDTGTGREDTLTVRVRSRGDSVHPGYDMLRSREEAGAVWKPAETLVQGSASDRIYTVRTDEKGVTTLTFGDGVNGARLPTGPDNIIATYRAGLGPQGNLSPGRIALLKSRMPGLRKATNPVPSTGGVAPETIETARSRAPLSVAVFGGLVSLADYERFAQTFPGIGQVCARLLQAGSRQVMAFAIAASDGAAVPSGSPLLATFATALRDRAARPFPVMLGTFRPVPFRIRLHVVVAAGLSIDDTRKSVIEALQQAYGEGAWPLACPLPRSEVSALIQKLPAVVAVEVLEFYRLGSNRQRAESLPANPLAWDSSLHQLRLPDRLQLDTENDAEVTAELAP